MNYQAFQLTHKLTNNDFIEVIRTEYPKYSKSQHSMCCHPEKYGLKLIPEAERLIRDKFTRRTAKRTKPNRVSARLDNATYADFTAHLETHNMTQQTLLEEIIKAYLEVMK